MAAEGICMPGWKVGSGGSAPLKEDPTEIALALDFDDEEDDSSLLDGAPFVDGRDWCNGEREACRLFSRSSSRFFSRSRSCLSFLSRSFSLALSRSRSFSFSRSSFRCLSLSF
jgi:hypothetical protein